MSAPESSPVPSFAALRLVPPLVQTLELMGFSSPTPIQAQAIPALLGQRDLFGQAATGTGKTAAFGLPMLQHLGAGQAGSAPRGLVLAPTRELAMQVATALTRYAQLMPLRIVAVFGGQPIGTQITQLRRGADVVVATPGRLVDLLQRRAVALGQVAHVVLDEADEMLDMGFADDLDAILAALPERRQTALFSATLPARLENLAARHMRDPVHLHIARPAAKRDQAAAIVQQAFVVAGPHKAAALARLLVTEAPAAAIVFCRTRGDVDRLVEGLTAAGTPADALHGGMNQPQRDRVMQRFRAAQCQVLVATDVAARGLDIDHVSHVFNYDLPPDPETYVHRIGRTGRAGRRGTAMALVRPNERRMLPRLERVTGSAIAVLPLPGAEALRARLLARATESLRTTLERPDLSMYAEAARALGDVDPQQLACAALALVDNGKLAQPLADIPQGPPRSSTGAAAARPARDGRGRAEAPPSRQRRNQAPAGWPVANLFVGAGHGAGVRPADLVGALAGELDLDARAIGAIHIAERYSIVEVPAEIADDIVAGMRGSTIKGKSVVIRRDRERRVTR